MVQKFDGKPADRRPFHGTAALVEFVGGSTAALVGKPFAPEQSSPTALGKAEELGAVE